VNKALNWFLRCLLYSNTLIAICAIAFLCEGYLLLGDEIHYDPLIFLTGASALFTYMLIRLVAVKRISSYEPDERWDFFLKHLKYFRIITIMALLISSVFYFMIPSNVQIALLVPGLISVLYGLPLGTKFRLRDIGLIKIFLIAFVWAYISSVLPAINSGNEISNLAVFILFLANYCFTFAITLPFDIKDLKIDKMNNVKTIPVYLGEENTYNLSALLLFISAGLHVYLQREILHGQIDYSIPISISILISLLIVWITRSKKKDNFLYFGILDGMILLQFLICLMYRERM
jgi:4-hydroxybenzoate polyprenyltransferase